MNPAARSAALRAARLGVSADPELGGAPFRKALTAATDAWLRALFDDAVDQLGVERDDIALVALGGYGRGMLAPGSDLDLAIVYRRRRVAITGFADAIWYPLWDAGIKLGHRVWGPGQGGSAADADVATATAVLDARHLCGNEHITATLIGRVERFWHRDVDAKLEWLHDDAAARRTRFGDVAFLVEPDIKSGGGGLRDCSVPRWIARAGIDVADEDLHSLVECEELLADIRIAHHRTRSSRSEVLRLGDQPAVAARLGLADADVLMDRVSGAARRVDWVLGELWSAVAGRKDGRRPDRAHHAAIRDADPVDSFDPGDPRSVLQVATAAARDRVRLNRPELDRFAARMRVPPVPWDPSVRNGFLEFLAAGPGIVDVIEAMDHVGIWERFVPEWPPIRHRPQRSPHHRFTVDRHLLTTVVECGRLAGHVPRGDLLVLAGLLHDLGKTGTGDHSRAGVAIAEEFTARIGLDANDAAIVVALVAHHLLLAAVATRRDLSDPTVIESVATTVGSPEQLALLAALTEADARATGPNAWTPWNARLIATLVEHTARHLGGERPERFGPEFPDRNQRRLLGQRSTVIHGEDRSLTVVSDDRPGLFAKVAGALTIGGLDIIGGKVATNHTMALVVVTVSPSSDRVTGVDWPSIEALVGQAMGGRFALEARVAERARSYRMRPRGPDLSVRVAVSTTAGHTTIEVDAPDSVGLLFRITTALANLSVDIRSAHVESRTDRVIDAFTVADLGGDPITDPTDVGEIERAMRHAARRL